MAYTAQYLTKPMYNNNNNNNNNNDSNNNKDYSLQNGDINSTDIYSLNAQNMKSSQPSNVILMNGDTNPKVARVYDDHNTSHTSTLNSPPPPTSQPTFHLVRKSSMHAPRVEAPPPEELKFDVYSVGVIMESRMTGNSFDPEKFKVEAEAPSGRVIKISGDGQYAAQFNPDEIGRWNVSMYYDNKYLDGCPIDVCDPSQVRVHNLKGGYVGKTSEFQVDCSRAGKGDLGVDIIHKGRNVMTSVSETRTPGLFKVNYTPYDPGAYSVNVHYNRAEVRETDFHTFDPEERQRKAVFYTTVQPREGYIEVKAYCDWEIDYITGGPFVCYVTDSTDISVYGMEDGTVCSHPVLIADCSKIGDGQIDAEVTHNGLRYPCKVRQEKPCVYRVSFKPKGPGTYKVWINYDRQPVKGSPFVQEIAELEKPTAHGDGLYRGVPGKPAHFTIDPRGFPGQVSVAVDGPSRPVSSELEPQTNNTIKATYHPTERGPHTVNVKIDGKNIEGSPYRPLIVDPVSVRVSGGWRPLLDERGVIPLKVNKEKHLPFDVSEAGPGELTSEVQGPNGKIPVAIDARRDGKHSVVFTPREQGKHYVHVNWGGYPLSNSPYLGYATHEPELDETYPDVRLVQIPLHSPDYRSFPSPRSSVGGSAVDGPAISVHESEISYNKKTDTFSYRPLTEDRRPVEEDFIQPHNKKQNDTAVRLVYPNQRPVTRNPSIGSSIRSQPRSPLSNSRPQKVVLSGKGLKEAEVGKPAVFYVDGTRANPGTPKSHMENVKQEIVPVKAQPTQPQVFKCSYTPEKPGAHVLYINWNNKPLKGSPFKVNVREPSQAERVTLTSDPHQTLGKDLEMKIDPRHAGPGQLTVKCTDPLGRDIPCQLSNNFDGTRGLKVTPKMPGRHLVEIKYNNSHIPGSPYVIDIQQDQVKGRVIVYGPGIESGVIPDFQSMFWVDATNAGSGDLRVRIMGPKGAFHVKMRKASQNENVYQCFYDALEPGVYTINVQWSGVHVEGSPFTALVALNPRDLERMQEGILEADSRSNIDDSRSSIIDGSRRRGKLGNSRHSNRGMNNTQDVLY